MNKKKIFIFSIVASVIMIFVFYGINNLLFDSEYREKLRISSPNKLIDAVYIREFSGGATGNVSQEIYLTLNNEQALSGELVFNGIRLTSLALLWENDSLLTIRFKSENGRILFFNDEVFITIKDEVKKRVKIKFVQN